MSKKKFLESYNFIRKFGSLIEKMANVNLTIEDISYKNFCKVYDAVKEQNKQDEIL